MKRAFPLRIINIFFLVSIGLLCLSLVVCAFLLSLQFKSYASSSDQYVQITRSALNMQEGSDYLTEQCRLFVLSTEFKYLENYFNEITNVQRRETSILELKKNGANNTSIQYLEDALKESNALAQQEYYAMKLVVLAKHYDKDPSKTIPEEILNAPVSQRDLALSDEYKISQAWLLMFSQDYISKKHEINELKSKAIAEIFDYSENTHLYNFTKLKLVFVHMISSITAIFIFVLIFFICVIILVIHPLYNFIRNIQKEEKLTDTHTKEFNILKNTYNKMFDKNEANEVLLRHKAEHDELTGLINRVAYNQIINALTLSEDSIALILLDVDKFKNINDNFGHSTGDLVLKRVAEALSENFRTTDYVCRTGGDEFTVILTKCDSEQNTTRALIESKLTKIMESLNHQTPDMPAVTLSCGITLSSKGYNAQMYDQADQALYTVKRNGRNGFSFFN